MQKNKNWLWQGYIIVYFVGAILNTLNFFTPGSAINTYYHLLISFHSVFLFPFLLNTLSILLNLLAVIFIYLWLNKLDWLSTDFARIFLVARMAGDLTGRSYEFHFLKSIFLENSQVAIAFCCLLGIIYLPSYIALYSYSFPKKDKSANQN